MDCLVCVPCEISSLQKILKSGLEVDAGVQLGLFQCCMIRYLSLEIDDDVQQMIYPGTLLLQAA